MPFKDVRSIPLHVGPLKNSAAMSGAVIGLSFQLTTTATATYGKIGLGSLEARMLLELSHYDAVKAAQLSNLLKSDPSAVSRTAKTLRDRGLVMHTGAKQLLCLTEAGRDIAEQVRMISQERERRLFAGISGDEAKVLSTQLDRLLGNSTDLADLAHRLRRFLAE